MAILVGIDEAGYGPLLGPLVVASTAFSVPDELVKSDLWEALSGAVSREKRHLAGRLLITDSKKAYHRDEGFGHLQRTVLAMLAGVHGSTTLPADCRQLLAFLCPDGCERLTDYPWYADLASRSLEADTEDIGLACHVLRRTLAEQGMRYRGAVCRCLDVAQYNRIVSAVRNKAAVLFTEVCVLIQRAFDTLPAGQILQALVDRQGGRINYQKTLSQMFPDLELTILKQHTLGSSYELSGRGKLMRLHFTVKADYRFLPVALASMHAKYIREILIAAMNRYFVGQCPHLKTTAGYWEDGKRFIQDLARHAPHIQYKPEMLIRSR
ncbi:MAG: hypothetical protein JW828_16575 [Sedimentisphaerales bacterium]|nr:hypothetical protein [Sedimentisphaerales bacterium]